MLSLLKLLERVLGFGTASAMWLFEKLAGVGGRLPRAFQFAFVVLMMLTVGPVCLVTESLRRFVVWVSNGLYGVHAKVTRDGIEVEDRRAGTRRHLSWTSIQSIVLDPALPPKTTVGLEDGEIEIDVVSEMTLRQESVRAKVAFAYRIDGVLIRTEDLDESDTETAVG